MRHEEIIYSCDKCGKQLPGHRNSLDIVTSLSETSAWSRLHVQILKHHGMHNQSKIEPADLCQGCAKELLRDAMNRVILGERATAGTEGSTRGHWDNQND